MPREGDSEVVLHLLVWEVGNGQVCSGSRMKWVLFLVYVHATTFRKIV